MSSVNVDLYLKDELEFEVRSRGGRPQGVVASLRKQIRLLIAAETEVSGFKPKDVALPQRRRCAGRSGRS